jgi:hypothetical protein
MSQIAAVTPTVAAELLSPDHGDTIVKPTPEPRSKRMRVTPTAAKAPPKMGPHDTADLEDSTGSAPGVCERDIVFSYRTKIARRIMIGSGTPRSQSRMPRPMMNSPIDIYSLRSSNVGLA